MNHTIIKCDLERDCIDYFAYGTMTCSQDSTNEDQQSSVGLQWWGAGVQALGTSVAIRLGFFKPNSRRNLVTKTVSADRQEEMQVCGFWFRTLRKAQGLGLVGAPADFPGHLRSQYWRHWLRTPNCHTALREKCQSLSRWFLPCYTAPPSKTYIGFSSITDQLLYQHLKWRRSACDDPELLLGFFLRFIVLFLG